MASHHEDERKERKLSSDKLRYEENSREWRKFGKSLRLRKMHFHVNDEILRKGKVWQ
jgi:carbonic anhydrase